MNGCSHMAHLKPARLVDLAEGVEAEQSVPHLAECDTCRRALAELRATMAAIETPHDPGSNVVPEPSPLFWDHLSARVRDAVAEEGMPARVGWLDRWLRPRVIAPVLAGALALVIVALAVRSANTPPPAPIPSSMLPVAVTAPLSSLPPLEPLGASDDPALGLIEDYGTQLGWDDMREEMAVVSHPGGTDEAVTTLSAEERQELQQLLEEEMAQPTALGAS
jgi:hypothetical protein